MKEQKIREMFVAVLFLCVVCTSCNRTKSHPLLYGKSFEEMINIAQTEKSSFCIVLSDPNCPPCTIYQEHLEEQNPGLQEQAIFNIIDVSQPQNRWYQQWVTVTALPTTCLFDKEGKLLAMTPGSGRRTFTCMENILQGELDCAPFFYTSDFFSKEMAYPEIITFLNEVLQCKKDLEEGKNIEADINRNLAQAQYPYNLYLKLQNQANHGDETDCKTVAWQLLSYSYEIPNIRLYGDVFRQCKMIINPDFNIAEEPFLTVGKNPVLLDCEMEQSYTIPVTLRNTGKKTLDIYDILPACSCLTYEGEKTFSLEAQEEKTLYFEFKPNGTGQIKRQIIIATNGIEDMVTIEIIASV